MGELSGRPAVLRATRAATAEPRVTEVDAAGVPATLGVPGGGLPRPALVFVNGVTARGRAHPLVRRLAHALPRAGIVVLVPDPPGLATGELTPATAEGVAAAAEWLCARPEVAGRQAGLAGVSLGTTLSLLAAERPGLRPHVSAVIGLAAFTSLPHTIRAGTTGYFVEDGRPFPYPASSFLSLVVGRSLVANLRDNADRERLRPLLLHVADDDPDPLAPLRNVDRGSVGEEARRAIDLLVNSDPDRFDDLYAALPEGLRARVSDLSPIERADELEGIPIELASAPRDAYFPLCESRVLVDLLPDCRLTVTGALTHAVPSTSLDSLQEAHALASFLARSLDLVTHRRSTPGHNGPPPHVA